MPIFVTAGACLAVITVFSTILIQPVTRAQALSTHVVATIPFAFQIGPYHLQPGVYRFEMQARGFLSIKGEVGSTVVLVMSPSTKRPLDGALVFQQNGDRYFLREVRTGGSKGFCWSGETRSAERRAKRQLAQPGVNLGPREESKVEIALLAPHR